MFLLKVIVVYHTDQVQFSAASMDADGLVL